MTGLAPFSQSDKWQVSWSLPPRRKRGQTRQSPFLQRWIGECFGEVFEKQRGLSAVDDTMIAR
jgi:hypothetical protein